MFSRCVIWLRTVTHSSLKFATQELNDSLDISGGQRPVPKDELRQFLSRSVLPILEGTSLDRRDNTAEMRHWLGQLLRDASFSAHVVKASPNGRFVRAITECIKQDSTRMHFIRKMTSAQASKVIEHLCAVGVRDQAVFATLLPRIEFTNLREVARVMFAFTEAGLSSYNVNLLVPLYCGETFSLTVSRRPNSPQRDDNAYCNLLDAVRVLRALSKSVRTTVEGTRRSDGAAALPHNSIHQFRNALVLFIMENAEEPFLRGAHWCNFARAMMHFPSEVDTLEGLAEQGGDALRKQRVLVRAVERLLVGGDSTAPWNGQEDAHLAQTPVTCAELARYGLLRVFDRAEGRASAVRAASTGTQRHAQAHRSDPEVSVRVFDLSSADLVKLVRVVQEVYAPASPLRRPRVTRVLDALLPRLPDIDFRGLLQLLQAMRAVLDDELSAKTVETVVNQAAQRLERTQGSADIPFPAFVEFCLLLSVFRIHTCHAAVSYICECMNSFPMALNGHTGLALLKVLAITRDSNLPARREAGLRVAERVTFYYHRESPLLLTAPLVCDKMWASLVLLDAVPTPVILERCCGSPRSAAPLSLTPSVREAGSIVLFDVSRSLCHFGKQASATAPEEVQPLWEVGVVGALLPLLDDFTAVLFTETQQGSAMRRALDSSYVPISWRTSMEAVTSFLDKAAPDQAVDMLAKIMARLKAIGRHAALWTQQLILYVEQPATPGTAIVGHQAQQRAFAQLPFSSNAAIHLLSFLLMFEHCVFRATWKCRGDGEPARLAASLKADYLAYLQAPLESDGVALSIMDTVARIFGAPAATAGGTEASLLHKHHALEITTNLPFAVSLVLEAGPVNEYFTEKTVPLMMAPSENDLVE